MFSKQGTFQRKGGAKMKKLFLVPLVIVLVGGLIFGGCAEPSPTPAPTPEPTPTPAPPAGPEEILIGNVESATGMFSAFSEGSLFGARVAVEDINEQGGVYVEEYGRQLPIRLVVVDNESDPAKASSLASDLILRDGVHVLNCGGGPCSLFNPVSITAERNKIPYMVSEGPVEPWLGARMEAEPPWQYTWGTGFAIAKPPPPGDFRAGQPGYSIIDTWFGYMDQYGEQTNKKVAVMASDDADGRGWYHGFPIELEQRGYDVIGEEKGLGLVPLGTTDFSAVINEWKDNNCEILWGNGAGPDFGTMLRQSRALDFQPKIIMLGRGANFYDDVASWGGDLPMGVCAEQAWRPEYDPQLCPGIGSTTPMSLYEEWVEETGKPLNFTIGMGGYINIQILADAIERAGSLDGTAISKAIGETDMMTLSGRAVFTQEEQHCRFPLTLGQWRKTDKPWVWECPVVYSVHDFCPEMAEALFPIPYE